MPIYVRKFLGVLLLVFICLGVSEAQAKKSKVKPKKKEPAPPTQKFELTKDHEKFDFTTLKPKLESSPAYFTEYRRDGTGIIYEIAIQMGNTYDWNAIKIVPKNSYFWLLKIFYPNGSLREKGLYMPRGLGVNIRFKKGIWYTYDKVGKLIKTEDFDEPFAFTFEDVLQYLKDNKIPLPSKQNPRRNAHRTFYGGFGTHIDRELNDTLENGKKGPTWVIYETNLPSKEIINKGNIGPRTIVYILDGTTGKLIRTREDLPD